MFFSVILDNVNIILSLLPSIDLTLFSITSTIYLTLIAFLI